MATIPEEENDPRTPMGDRDAEEDFDTPATVMSGGHSFMELAMAGQKLLKAGEHRKAIAVLEFALKKKWHDLSAVSIVHSQLGMCYSALGDTDNAIKHHQADMDLARDQKDTEGVAKAYANIANVFKTAGRFNESILCYEQQLDITRLTNDKRGQCRALANLGSAYQAVAQAWLKQEDHDLALEYCVQAVKYTKQSARLAEQLRDKAAMGKAYGNLGILYELLEEHDKAALCHKKRLKLAQESGDRAAESRAYCNLGNAYRAQCKYDKALECYQRDLALSIELGDEMGHAITLSNIGNTHQAMGHIDETVDHFEQHLRIMEDLQDKSGMAWGYSNLARVNEAVGRFEEAKGYLEKQAQLAREMGDPVEEKSVNTSLARVRHLIEEGVTVEQSKAIQALLSALDSANTKVKSKRTLRATMRKFFSKRVLTWSSRTGPHQRESTGSTGTAVDMLEMSDSVGAGSSDRLSIFDGSLSGSLRSNTESLSTTSFPVTPEPRPRTASYTEGAAAAAAAGAGAGGAAAADARRQQAQSRNARETRGRMADLYFGDPEAAMGGPPESGIEEGFLQTTDLDDLARPKRDSFPEPLAEHRAAAELLLHQLGLLDKSFGGSENSDNADLDMTASILQY